MLLKLQQQVYYTDCNITPSHCSTPDSAVPRTSSGCTCFSSSAPPSLSSYNLSALAAAPPPPPPPQHEE